MDFYSKSAAKFLSLIPSYCELYKLSSQPTSPTSSRENLNNSAEGQVKIDTKSRSDLVFYRSPLLRSMYQDVCPDYLEYLADARVALRNCKLRCTCWSAPYNGQDPSPSPLVERQRSDSNAPSMKSGVFLCANGSIPGKDSGKKSRSTSDIEPPKGNPDLGPFIDTLFQKVEKMPQNTFYVNLILTGVITRLACYPQPLLRSFLLNYNMVLKPGVRSLFQVCINSDFRRQCSDSRKVVQSKIEWFPNSSDIQTGFFYFRPTQEDYNGRWSFALVPRIPLRWTLDWVSTVSWRLSMFSVRPEDFRLILLVHWLVLEGLSIESRGFTMNLDSWFVTLRKLVKGGDRKFYFCTNQTEEEGL